MLKNILALISILSLVEGDFDYKFKYCRLRCGCGNAEKEKSNEPSDYYWRDFYGTIPSDAFPVGDEKQYPQTYVGLVFDPENNGTYVTTIVDGLDYVYNAVKGKVFKRSQVIQILCTQEPERFAWTTLTPDNSSSVSDYLFVSGGVHQGTVRNQTKFRGFFVVKLSKCQVGYASGTASLIGELEFAAIDGSLQKSSDKMFLLYKKNKTESVEDKNKPFISHYYRYNIRGGSIIPSFYKQLNIGSCSLICTNEGMDKNKNKHADPMEYYWKPSNIFNQNEGVLVGYNTYNNKSQFIGQAYTTVLNWFDVGQSEGKSVTIGSGRAGIVEDLDVHILSSKHQKNFEWISTSTDKFPSLDKSRMIPGGKLNNDSLTFVGREVTPTPIGTSIRLLQSGAYSFSTFGAYNKFDVLMIKNDE
ncbi:hypothetical protein WA026_006182 [Henosepilachna vigintioctopunctata]|uniref:Uncharacterized protein n=1 Tax=Henosepilachna vigintioctopunctata TaxID=420089 RepID=A0AAW1THZ8_9CUCU